MADYRGESYVPWYQALHGYNSANAGVTVRVVIGEGVTHISSYLCAPMNKICEDISLPSTLTSIGDYAFNWLERGLPETLVLSEQVEEIGTYAFNNCKGLKKVVIENPRVQLNNYAFYSARDLEEIVLPEGVTAIPKGVTAIPKGFARSAPLKSIDLPDTVKTIGDSAFDQCAAAETIHWSAALTTIGFQSFRGCSSLTGELALPDTVKTIGKESFLNCSSFTSIHWPAALESVGDGAFHSAGFTGNFTVPAGVTFGSEVFYFCEEITSLTLPAQGIKKAGSDLFRACSGLTHVTIPEGWTSMPISAFENCTGLTSVSLPQSLTSIPGSAFADCTALTSVELPEGLETINSSAFMGCTALPALLIVPESVKTVGVSAYLESGAETIRFLGNAPTSVSDKGDYGSFPEECVLYYSPDKENWTTPQWHGYNTYAILGEGDYRFHDADYYSSLSLRSFTFRADVGPQIDHPVSSVTLTYQGNSISTTGDSSALSAAILQQEGEQISFTQSKMFDVSLPVEVLSTFNTIQFYPASGTYAVTKPFVQAVYARHDDGDDYTDLLHSQLKFYAGSLTEETALYVQMNWNGHTPGKLYLSQTLNPADGVAVEEDFSDAGYLGLRLKAGQGLYLLMEYEGKVEAVPVGAAILSEDTSMKLNLGKSFGVEKPQDNFLSEFSFDVDLPLDTSMSLTVKNDGTVKALFGLELDKDSDEDAVFDTMQDYFEYEHQKENGLDLEGLKHLLKSRGAGVTLQRCSFVTSGSVNFLGCAEGHIVKYDNGQYGIVLSKGTVGLSFEGGVTQTFQMYAFSAPFYVSGSIKPKVTFNVTLYANEASEGLSLAPIDVKASIAMKIAGGLGWDSIASLGIYGKGSGELSFKVPFLEDTSSCTFQGSVGAEATVFSFSADLVIFEGEKIYLWGGDNAASVSLQALREADWKPQSRDYLTGGSAGVSYAAVDGENTVLTAQTAVETIYPYASVQTADLPGGGQVAVWTEDPGRSVRPVDNNRTVLYYSYYDGSSWTAPAAVEAVDDGTADFNPVVRVMNGQVYVVWQDAARPLTAADTPDTIPAVIDLSCAVFDETTRTFTTLATVGTEYYDTTADLVWMEDGPAVVWTSNSSNQPMGGGAVCALHRQKIGAETAQTLADGLGVVDGLTAEGAQVWFSADTDGVADTFSDREIFHYDGAELRQLTDNAVADTKPARTGGTTIWYSGGTIQAGENIVTLQADTDRYQYLRSASGMEAIVYVTDGEDRSSTLYASFNDGTGWGAPMALTGTAGNIGSFSAAFLSDGTLSVVACERGLDASAPTYLSGSASLTACSVTPYCDVAIDRVAYLEQSLMAGGTLDLSVRVKNNGMAQAGILEFTVKNGDQVVASTAVDASLASGQSGTYYVGVPLGDDPTAYEHLTVTATPMGYTDSTEEDNTADVTLRLTDLSVEGAQAIPGDGSTSVTTLVVNRGQLPMGQMTVTLYDADGTSVIDRQTLSAPAVGEGTFVTFEVDGATEGILTVEAVAEGIAPTAENLAANNSCTVVVEGLRTQGFTLSGTVSKEETVSVVAQVQNATTQSESYSLCFAAYDEGGRMVDVCYVTGCETEAGGQTLRQATFAAPVEKIRTVRIFALNGTAPLTAAAEYTL